MNNNLHRIVFNKKRGQLMAVAETASAQGKGARGETTAGSGKAAVQSSASALRSVLHSILALAWGTALLVQPLANIAQAQIVANQAAPGGQRPTVLGTANGLPQVNIQTPSAAGVSRNAYSQFDVQRSGIILNNSRTNVQTQLGGFVQGNPWLATGSARVILNEVSSSNPSQLGGYVEVAGQRAEVIIANPAGINVNGGGFLNASRVTLTTGTAMLNSTNGGSLESYRVQGGAISLTGAGLDTSTADYTNILARSFQANAGLWAKDLKVVTGGNDINAASLSSTPVITPIAGSGQAPAFAVDIGQLGGMYAGKIMLIGSETGIGVNNAGFLGATAGSVMLQTNGWLTSSGVIQASAASANTSVQSTGITNSGTLTAANILSVATPGALDNSRGSMNARRLDISAAALRNMGGTIEQTGSQALTLQGRSLSNAGGIIGALPVSANSPSALSTGTIGGTTTSNSGTTSTTSTSTGNAGSTNSAGASSPASPIVLADGVLRVTGALNNDGGRIRAAGSMDLASQNGLNNNAGTLSLRQLSVAGGDVNNQGGSLRTSGDMLLLTGSNRSSGQLNNQDGHLTADGQLQISANGINNLRGEIVQTSASDTVITANASAPGSLDNASGRIASNAQNLTLSAASITSADGKIEHAGSGTLDINVANSGANNVSNIGAFSGQRGQITSNGALQLTAGAVNLDNASTSAQALSLNVGSLSNRSGDIVQSGTGASTITASGAIDNSAGRIASNGNTVVTAQSLNNQGGKLQATGTSALGITTTGALDNSAGGEIAASGDVRSSAGVINNNQGRITAGTSLIAASGGLLSNNQGLMAANGNVNLSAASIDNTGGSMASAQSSASLSSAASTVNDGGRIQAAGAVALVNSGLSNAAGSIAGRTVSIQSNAQAVNNAQGTIAAVQQATLQTGALNNDKGLIQAGGALDINTGGQALTNTHAAGYANGAGGISTQGAMTLNTGPAGSLDNAAGFIGAKGALTANTASVSNINGGQIVGEAAVNWTSTGFDNRSGQLQALGDVRINAGAAGTLNNTGGLVRSAQTTTLLGASVINSNTLGTNQGIEGGNNIVITASTIANDNGAMRADNNLTLSAGVTVNNNAGLLSAGNTLTVQDPAASPTLALYNAGGTLIAGQNVVISAATAGGDGQILSRGNLSLALTGGFVNSGEVTANRDASISAASVTNSGKLQAAGTLSIAAGDIDNTATGEIMATTTKLNATNSLSNRGLIDGVNTQINAGTLNNIGTGRIYGDTLSIAAATLNNDAETVGGVTTKGSIAARQQLDIGVGTLNNRDGALILSGGDMAIGGSLDAGRKATGSADAINNAGSTIESFGKLAISAALINNTNSGFAYDLTYSTGPAAGDYITGSGNFSGADVGWVLGGAAPMPAAHGGYVYANYRQGRVLPASSAYGNSAYQTYYDGPTPHQAAAIVVLGYDGDGGEVTTLRPEKFAYDASSAVWALFGVAPPTAAPPTGSRPTRPPRPVAFTDSDTGASYTPTLAELAAWDAATPAQNAATATWDTAAAPWLALQTKFDAFRSSVDASAQTFSGFRQYTQQVATVNVTSSTPGRLLSGGNMTIYASNALNNDQSQIIAGGALNITGQTVNNVARTTTFNAQRNGHAYAWSHYDDGCGNFFHGCNYSYDAYRDSVYRRDLPQTLSLSVAVSHGSAAPTYKPDKPPAVANGSTSAITSTAGQASASARSAGIVQVTASAADPTSAQPRSAGNVQGNAASPGSAEARNADNVQATGNAAGTASASGPVFVIRTSSPSFTLPTNSIFATNPNPTTRYLVETDPRFTNYRNWLGSDYLLSALGLDPGATQKRLGDGFYEQRLVREQVAQLTGQRFLSDYSSDEAQYKALMDSGVTLAQSLQLRPGIALSGAQMVQLTSDIVWLVEQSVSLADGTTSKVLVPQVYVRVKDGDIDGAGALLAGKSININLTGDLTNSGTIAGSTAGSMTGRNIVNLTAQNVQNLGGRITGGTVALAAVGDLNNIGGQIDAANALVAVAGRDLNITSTTSSATNRVGNNTFSLTGIDRIAALYVSNPGGTLLASAGRDVNLTAAILQSEGSLGITAGNNLNLATVKTSSANAQVFDQDNYAKDSQSRDIGSQLNAANKLALTAGNDLNAKAASVNAGNALSAVAGNTINLTAGQQTSSSAFGMTSSESGFFSSSNTKESKTAAQTSAAGTSVGGSTINLNANKDINIKGSSVISDSATTLVAGDNVNIEAASNTSSSTSFFEKKESGFLSGGGFGISYGNREQSTDNKGQNTTAAASTVGAIAGNVSIDAGQAYKQAGSDVIAPGGDISILAKKVDIVEARETTSNLTEQKFKQTALILSVGSPLLSAVQQAQGMAQAAGNTSDARMQALAGASAALNVYNNAGAIGQSAQALTSGNPQNAASITVSLGTSKSQSLQQSQSDSAKGSSVTAGGNVSISALGAGQDSNILVQGSSIKAGNNASLAADNQVNLLAAQNTASQTGTNTSNSGSLGVSYGAGGWGFSASASKGQGSSNGQDSTFTNTQIAAGNTASIQSAGDTKLKGAVIAANTVTAKVGGSLSIESLQDTSSYASKQSSAGGSISVGATGITGGGASASQSKIDSNFKSVGQQSGIKAGDGGFNVTVNNNTDLKGAVIASTQAAVDNNKNTFTTGGALSISDLQNSASFKGSAAGVSADVGQQAGKFGVSGVGVGVGSDKGSASSTTTAGISGIAGNTAVRSTDTETGLKKIFDATKVQREIDAQVQITQAFSKEAPKAVATYAQEKYDQLKLSNPEEAKKWAEGGVYRVALHIATGALGGGVSGALGAGVSASSAELMNGLQDGLTKALMDTGMSLGAAQLLAQGVSTLTMAGVGAAVGGVQGAATAATVDANNRQLHPTERTLAMELAATSKGKYSVEQIEAAMRLSGIKGSSIGPDSLAVMTNPSSTDPSVSGARFDNGMPLLPNTGMVLVEQRTLASPELIVFVQQATGGANSPYYWSAQTSNPATISNTQPDTGGPRFYGCATTDCLLYGANRNPNNLQNQAEAQRAQNAMVAAGLIVGAPIAVAYGVPSAALGFGLGSGFDAAGQYVQSGTVRPAQSFVAGLTGAAALPLAAGRNFVVGAAVGAGAAGLNTSFNNYNYGEATTVVGAMGLGALFGGLGTVIGGWTSNFLSFTAKIPASGTTPTFPVTPLIGAPYANQIGNTVSNTIGGTPSFIPLDANVNGAKK